MKFKQVLNRWKQMSKRNKIITVVSIFLLLCLTGGALAYRLWFLKPRESVTIDANGDVVVTQEEAKFSLDHRINILLVGVDERKNSQEQTYRTDSLILASVDPQTQQIAMVSIPRDTRIEIPKRGLDKINAAAAYGGLNMTVAVVQQLTGVKVDGYVKTNFDGFKDIIDTLGGVTVNVEKNMYYETGDKVDGVINLKKGEQLLDGSKALQYARFRHDTYADITRTARQQIILKAVAKKLMQPGTITKIPTLVSQFSAVVDTNLPPADLLTLAKVAVNYDSSKVISQTLPGYFLDDEGISYWGVDPVNVKKVVANLFNSGTVIGNDPDKLITASVEESKGSNKPVEQAPEISIGGIAGKALSSSSISIDVTVSRGISRAEVWRTTPEGTGQYKVGNSWSGTNAWHFVDSSLESDTDYVYLLKVYDATGNLIAAKKSNTVTTLVENTNPVPPTNPDTGA
jgi:polyisoprenyl-teichoic acid--peptidoglycan teichoic acid transferase